MVWTDVHCHLDLSKNIVDWLDRSKKGQVTTILAQSTTLESAKKVLDLQEKYPSIVKACLGYFPRHVFEDDLNQREKTVDFISKNASKAVALGEIGLDFDEKTTDFEKKAQESVFVRLLGIAKQNNLPVIVHTRGCRKEMLDLLEKNEVKKVVMHSFVGSKAHLDRIVQNGYFVSVGAGVLNQDWISHFVKEIPLNHILLESDGPLDFGNGSLIDSSAIPIIAQKVAELKGVLLAELQDATQANLKRLFTL